MDQDHAGIAGLLGIARPSGTDQPRLTLVPARCAVGISASGAGFRVVHTMSGKYLGTVARLSVSYLPGAKPVTRWGYACPQGCADGKDHESEWTTAHAAATALSAHMLDHGLALIRARLAAADGEVA